MSHSVLAELPAFTGSETVYHLPMFPRFHFTEGVRYLARQAGAYWLLDAIFSHQCKPALRAEGFQVWELTVRPDRQALLTCTNGNDDSPALAIQRIPFTDFPAPGIKLYFTGRTLMLPGEY